uniref:Transmembrane protein n=1 Tax=Palpitomonas bilix TaxID=652834 RepID=A0A7S3G008_9EUKA|eukprot:CAMPEP_0113897236 /NCGR_PEP_ID=MMETSP0780_2-20120614/18548_1 /TAXON_ID=652834 /ORGANISM="Palpitomonas bilix" /LENGTH=469 /DNA_ID=CAMNT_0000888639 /DNA_START=161 /DNA_END=1570 /DNA_ORIENTATION=+ /assembly_acc=CAM_ASM_000599
MQEIPNDFQQLFIQHSVLAEMELKEYELEITRLCMNMSRGDFKFMQWNLKSGEATYPYNGVMVTLRNEKGEKLTEVFAHDAVFAHFGLVKNPNPHTLFFRAMEVNPSSKIIASAIPVTPTCAEPGSSKNNLQKARDVFFFFQIIRFFGESTKKIFSKLNSVQKSKLSQFTSNLIKFFGRKPEDNEEGVVRNPYPRGLEEIARGENDNGWAQLIREVPNVKKSMKTYFQRLFSWFGRNKKIAAFVVGGAAIAAAVYAGAKTEARASEAAASNAGQMMAVTTAVTKTASAALASKGSAGAVILAYPMTSIVAALLVGGAAAAAIVYAVHKLRRKSSKQSNAKNPPYSCATVKNTKAEEQALTAKTESDVTDKLSEQESYEDGQLVHWLSPYEEVSNLGSKRAYEDEQGQCCSEVLAPDLEFERICWVDVKPEKDYTSFMIESSSEIITSSDIVQVLPSLPPSHLPRLGLLV